MEWMNRNDRPGQATGSQPAASHATPPTNLVSRGSKKLTGTPGLIRWSFLALLFSATILVVATICYSVISGNSTGKAENSFVNKKQMQAVFLNGGQVYFGKIGELNSKYLSLDDIYYLRVNQQVQPNTANNSSSSANDISLVKLGCELHGPQDKMVINREQVIFWENLKTDGQVAQAVAKYKTDNPDQKCTQAASTNNTNTNTNSNTTPSTTTPSTKK